jgi:hypothetical protein
MEETSTNNFNTDLDIPTRPYCTHLVQNRLYQRVLANAENLTWYYVKYGESFDYFSNCKLLRAEPSGRAVQGVGL